MATAKDVAERAGTSTATVSYVLNNGPRQVSQGARERVLQAAQELNYHPHAAARALTVGKTNSYGLIVPSIQNPFFGELSNAVEMAAKDVGHLLLIADSAMDPDQERRQIDAFVGRRVDGVVLISCAPKQDLELVLSNGIPVVALHPILDNERVRTVHMDYRRAASDLTEHLLVEHNVNSLLVLIAKSEEGGSRDHKLGIKDAINKFNPNTELREIQSEVSRASAYSATLDFVNSNPNPEAVYCATDEQAYGVLSALNSLGIRVPHDVKVVGFDGTKHSRYSIPPLTTIRQPLKEIAKTAIGIFMDDDSEERQATLLGELVIRESCGCQWDKTSEREP